MESAWWQFLLLNVMPFQQTIVVENHLSAHYNHCIINHTNNQKLYNLLYIIGKFHNKGIGSSVITLCKRETHCDKILARYKQNNSKKYHFFKKLGLKNRI